jgi:hypothetical protein
MLGTPVALVPLPVDPAELGMTPEVVAQERIVLPPPLDLVGPAGHRHDQQGEQCGDAPSRGGAGPGHAGRRGRPGIGEHPIRAGPVTPTVER